MAVDIFELFHGLVLAKIVRSGRPITLKKIEISASEAWAAYVINDNAMLYIKHSASPEEIISEDCAWAWNFSFKKEHLSELKEFSTRFRVFLASVCGRKNVAEKMEVCILTVEELNKCIDMDVQGQQSVRVKHKERHSLRVSGSKTTASEEKLIIQCNRIDTLDFA